MEKVAWNKGIYTTSDIRPCEWCKKDFKSIRRSKTKTNTRFCSNSCRARWQEKDKTVILICPTCSKEFRTTPGHLPKGKKYCSNKCVYENDEWRSLRRNWTLGEKSHFWKGGVTIIHRGIRHTSEYQRARKQALKRDNYTCTLCGAKEELHVDHIKSFSIFKDLRCDLNNLRTLCFSCHKKTPSYGRNIGDNGS